MSFEYKPDSFRTQESEDFNNVVAASRRAPQFAAARAVTLNDVETFLAGITQIEMNAGPKLAGEIAARKAFQSAPDYQRHRKTMSDQLMAQRAGLLKLLQAESSGHDLLFPTSRVRLYVSIMLQLSANLAAITGSKWSSTLVWFRKRLAATVDRIGTDWLEAKFEGYLSDASKVIAARPIRNEWDFHAGLNAKEIAETLGITKAQIALADAVRNRLTSVDAVPKPQRDRERHAASRIAQGMTPQSQRNVRARDLELGALAGVSDRTIRNKRLEGSLAGYLAAKGVDVPEAMISQMYSRSKKAAASQNRPTSKESALSQKCLAYKEIDERHSWEEVRASYVYGREPMPSRKVQAQTLAALVDGAPAAWAEFTALDPVFGSDAGSEWIDCDRHAA